MARASNALPIRRITLSDKPFSHTAKCLICGFQPAGFTDEDALTRHMTKHRDHFCQWHMVTPEAFVVAKGDDDLVVNAAEFTEAELQAMLKLQDLVSEMRSAGTPGRYTPGMAVVRRDTPGYRYARYEWLCQLLGQSVVETRDIWTE